MKGMFKFIAVAAAALMMAACGNDKEYSQASEGNMIPDNAVIAMKVNAAQIWDKALGAEDSQLRQAWDEAKSLVPIYAAAMGEVGTLVSDAITDPAKLGINLDAPAVVSVSADVMNIKEEKAVVEVCLALLLDDSKAFVNCVDKVLDLAKKEAGLIMNKEVVDDAYTYYSCSPEKDVYVDMGIADNSVTVRIQGGTLAKDADHKASMMGLYANGGPAKTEGLDAFYAANGELTAWVDFQAFAETIIPVVESEEPMIAAQMKQYMPMYKGLSYVTDLSFKNGQTVLQMDMFGSEEMVAYTQKYSVAASDKYLADIPFIPMVAVNIAMKDFAGMVNEMCAKDKQIKEGFDYLKTLGIDENLFAGFPGNITFALEGCSLEQSDMPGMILMMDCGENVWEYIKPYLEMYCDEPVPGIYCYANEFCVKYEDGTIKAADLDTFIAAFVNGIYGYDYAQSYLGGEIAEGGMVFDLTQLDKADLADLADEVDRDFTAEDLLGFINSVVVTIAPDHMSSTLTLNMGDKNQNLIGKIVQYVAEDAVAGMF